MFLDKQLGQMQLFLFCFLKVRKTFSIFMMTKSVLICYGISLKCIQSKYGTIRFHYLTKILIYSLASALKISMGYIF